MRRSITRPSLAMLSIAAALALAACGDSDDDGEAEAPAGGAGSGLVSTQEVEGTEVLVDSEGRVLYVAEVERDGVECVDACTSIWAPVAASRAEAESADVDADLGVTERPDGTRQLTAGGLPLYTFTQEGPGELEGDGVADTFEGTRFEWRAATVGAEPEPQDEEPAETSPGGGYDY